MTTGRLLRALSVITLAATSGCAGTRPLSAAGAPPKLDPAILNYLNAAFDTLQRVTRHTNVQWSALRDSAYALAVGARQPRDVYPVVDWLLSAVDNHSFLQASRFGARDATLDGSVGYIRVPFWGSGSMEPTLADTLQNMIRRQQAANVCRWIVDLRANGGGNMWPMLAGIGPLLGDSIVGGNVGPKGRSLWKYKDGVSTLVHEDGREEVLVRATVPPVSLRVKAPPVAVLVDASTGSSGEVMTVAFRGRPNARLFGSPTAGATTTNQGFRLPDGANMVITVGVYVDRLGNRYGTSVAPDDVIHTPLTGPTMLRGDPVVAGALDWLARQSCDR